jgi:hypothetical protein
MRERETVGESEEKRRSKASSHFQTSTKRGGTVARAKREMPKATIAQLLCPSI